VNQLYATHLGAERLKSRVEGPTHSTSHEGTAVPVVDIVASRSEDGRSVFIKAVNTIWSIHSLPRSPSPAPAMASTASVEGVIADSLDVSNSFTTPDAVRTTKADVAAGNRFTLELPPHSVSVITLAITK
jgi:alpha-L-arabinofuranosidase